MGNSQSSSNQKQASKVPLTSASIREAVRLWCEDPAQATAEHGRIEDWDTSEVTDV